MILAGSSRGTSVFQYFSVREAEISILGDDGMCALKLTEFI